MPLEKKAALQNTQQVGRSMQNRTNEELIEIICKQNKIISELLSDNAEKENMINVLMGEFNVK